MSALDPSDFWSPAFDIATRDDGTILMAQRDPLPEHLPTLADYLDLWAEAAPDRPWIARRHRGGAWHHISYGAARDRVRRLGAGLLAMGLGPDRPLLILSGNTLNHALLGAACFYVGIPYAPVSPAYSQLSADHAKLRDIAALLSPGAVYAEDGAAFAPAIAAIARPGMTVITGEGASFDAVSRGDPARAVAARSGVRAETVVKYLFTSGSTGSPKAVINTNGMICAMQAMVRACYRFLEKRPPVVVDWAPWNHTAAGNKVFYMVMTNGGTYYVDDGKPAPGAFDETLRNLREIASTWYFTVPVGWDLLVEELERDDALAGTFFSRLDMMLYAGAGMAQHTWDRLRAVAHRVTGHEVLLAAGFGSTETAPFALACTEVQDRAGNVGVPAPGLRMKLVPEGGKLELRLKGPSITPGYYGDPARTAEAFDDEGYFRMGDALRPADPDDLGRGFLFDGRVAENFKLTTGTWVAVGAVRAGLVDAMGGLIRDAVIAGEDEVELGAILIPSARALQMAPDALRAALADRLAVAAAAATGSAACVRRAVVLTDEPSFDKGEVTEKGSLNQRAMRRNHAALIAALYAGQGDVIVA